MKENLYTAYYAMSEDEEIVRDREIEIPKMEQQEAVSEKKAVADIGNADMETYRKEDVSVGSAYSNIEEGQLDSYDVEHREMDNVASVQRYADKNETIADAVSAVSMVRDKAKWIADKLSAHGTYEMIDIAVKADIFGFDITDVSGSIRLFSDVMKKLGIKLDGDGIYEEFQRIYDQSVSRDTDKEKAEDKIWNRGRGR